MGYCYWNNFCLILFFYFIDMKITEMKQVLFGEQKLDNLNLFSSQNILLLESIPLFVYFCWICSLLCENFVVYLIGSLVNMTVISNLPFSNTYYLWYLEHFL